MQSKWEDVKVDFELALPPIEYETLKFCLKQECVSDMNGFVEKKIRDAVKDALSDEHKEELPGYIKLMISQEQDEKDKRKRMVRMAKFLQNTPYDLRREKIHFKRHAANPSFALAFMPYDKDLSDDIKKAIYNAHWNKDEGAWVVPINTLDKVRDAIYKNLGVRSDLYDYDKGWLCQHFHVTMEDVQEVLISIADGA